MLAHVDSLVRRNVGYFTNAKDYKTALENSLTDHSVATCIHNTSTTSVSPHSTMLHNN